MATKVTTRRSVLRLSHGSKVPRLALAGWLFLTLSFAPGLGATESFPAADDAMSPVDTLIAGRVRAIEATADANPRYEEFGRLIWLLGALNESERASIGPPSVRAIVSLLTDSLSLIRSQAACQLGALGRRAASALPALEVAKQEAIEASRQSAEQRRRWNEEAIKNAREGGPTLPLDLGPTFGLTPVEQVIEIVQRQITEGPSADIEKVCSPGGLLRRYRR